MSPDTNRAYHDRDVILAGLAYQRYKIYRTSYLFADGETESMPIGFSATIDGGLSATMSYVYGDALISGTIDGDGGSDLRMGVDAGFFPALAQFLIGVNFTL